MSDAAASQDKITRDDIDATLRSVVGQVEQKAADSARRLLPAAVGAGVVLLVIAYFLGRRVGTARSTVVEIRRI
ncbi:MAG: hypothetical protein OXB92_07050 [Acidimicrobiaceae bacterium]|nr:hypothetical protein [Acidimicrobiia bacterium]MCY4493593.1 hypothetical protein [Acidimicrobiaceae bacterium]